MKKSEISELREFLRKELKEYNDEPINLAHKIDKEILQEIIFDNNKYKTFGLDEETLSKIDFGNGLAF